MLVLLGGGAAAGWAYVAQARKQPALDALRAGNQAFEPVASGLRLATDIEGLRSAAEPAEAAADRIDRAADPIASPDSELERRVRAVLRDEAALLRAAAGLTAVEIETLGRWPGVRDSMSEAETSLDAAVKQLAKLEAKAARTVRTGRALAVHSDEVVGEFAGGSMTDLLDAELDALTDATTTADLVPSPPGPPGRARSSPWRWRAWTPTARRAPGSPGSATPSRCSPGSRP